MYVFPHIGMKMDEFRPIFGVFCEWSCKHSAWVMQNICTVITVKIAKNGSAREAARVCQLSAQAVLIVYRVVQALSMTNPATRIEGLGRAASGHAVDWHGQCRSLTWVVHGHSRGSLRVIDEQFAQGM